MACRIRRLSERLDRDLRDIYQANGVYFDPAWFPVVAALNDHGPLSLIELGDATGLGAASISALRGRLVSEGVVEPGQDPRDLRRQRLSLTPKGRALVLELEALWCAIGKASQALCAETAPALLSELEVLEQALHRRRLPARVKAHLGGPDGT